MYFFVFIGENKLTYLNGRWFKMPVEEIRNIFDVCSNMLLDNYSIEVHF